MTLTFGPWIGHRRGDDCPATGLGGIAETGVGVISTDEQKRRERGHAVGLFRYQLICPALDSGLSTKARGRIVREIAAREHTDPFGASVRYSRDTLDRWIRRYRAGGFEELIPSTRAACPRTDAATLELAAALKRENPARTAAQVSPDPAGVGGVGAVGVDAAAALSPPRVDRPGRRRCPGGVRALRSRQPE